MRRHAARSTPDRDGVRAAPVARYMHCVDPEHEGMGDEGMGDDPDPFSGTEEASITAVFRTHAHSTP